MPCICLKNLSFNLFRPFQIVFILFAINFVVNNSAFAEPKFVTPSVSTSIEGKKAFDFSLITLDGQSVSLKSLKGKTILLDFWASWCGPCRRSMPHLQSLYQQYKDKGFVIVGVNVDKDKAKAEQFLKGLTVSYPLALDPTAKTMGSYQVMQMPTAFLIDKDGVVRHKIVGFSDEKGKMLASQIEALLNK